MYDSVMAITVDLPASQARELRDAWEQRAFELEEQAAELRAAVKAIDAQMSRSVLSEQRAAAPIAEKGSKRRKGENLRVIQSWLQAIGEKGATVAEICAATKIGQSSVTVVLNRHPEVFSKGSDKLWRSTPK